MFGYRQEMEVGSLQDFANLLYMDWNDNALCRVMRGSSVGIIGLFFLKTALWAYFFVERSGFL